MHYTFRRLSFHEKIEQFFNGGSFSCELYSVFTLKSETVKQNNLYGLYILSVKNIVQVEHLFKDCILNSRHTNTEKYFWTVDDSPKLVLRISLPSLSSTEDLGQEGNVRLSFVVDGFALLLCLLEVLLGQAFVLKPFQVDLFFCRMLFVVPRRLLYDLSLLLLLLP